MHIAWVTYCMCEGKRDGYFYFLSPNGFEKYGDLHKLYTVQRTCVVVGLLIADYCMGNWQMTLLGFFILALSFSYLHNGAYFAKRNDLNPMQYLKRWRDDSSTSRALINFRYINRLIQAIISLILFLSGVVLLIFVNYYE